MSTNIDLEEVDSELRVIGPNGYRNKYRRIMLYLIGLLLSALIFLIIFLVQLWVSPKTRYFSTTITGSVRSLQSLDMPIVSDAYLLQWAGLAIRSVYNLNFNNYEQQLKQASAYFTGSGYNSLMDAFNKAKVIKTLKDKKLIMSAVIDGAGVIISQGASHGRYTWEVQIPFLATYASASDTKPARFVATMNITRVPVVETAKNVNETPSSIRINNVDITRYYR